MKDMQNGKHTPGPWRAIAGPFGEEDAPTIVGTKSEGVADIVGYVGQDRWADAHLIAAAPDLLEACRCALRLGPLSLPLEERSLFKAAIAKAEGRSDG